jgi:hypothetical protein
LEAKIRVRIRITVKVRIRIRIRIKVMRIRNTAIRHWCVVFEMICLPHLTIQSFKIVFCILTVLVRTGVQAVAEVRHACSQGPLQQLLLGHRL